MFREWNSKPVLALLAGLMPLLTGMAACPPSEDGDIPPSTSRGVCGNDRRQTGEKCDGPDLNDKTCEDLGFASGALLCKPDCKDFDRSACGAPLDTVCGNNVREGVETCDLFDLDGESCESLGWGAGLLACRQNCGEFDVSMCGPPPDCGDGNQGGIEICDGADFGGLTCQRLGYQGGELSCAVNCMAIDRSGCIEECTPNCSGRVCGTDPVCGISCGTCSSGTCNASGQCESSTDGGPSCPASRDCSGRVCGPDPVCGTSCGTCSSGSCNTSGQCVGTTSCTQGSTRCSTDSYGVEACGVNLATSNTEYGPRVPCPAGYSCSSGVCGHGACVRTEVALLVDRSSSMLDGDTWIWVKNATLAAAYYYDGLNALGFKPFPGSSGCTAGTLSAMATGSASTIEGRLTDPTTNASTPMEDALSNLASAYGDPNAGQAVILVSDGDETCGTATGAVAQASNLFRTGVKVYTIAVTTTANRTLLNQIAQVGGTGTSRLVTSAQTLFDTYKAIFAELGACADCDGSKPSCSSSTMIRFCDGDTMQDYDCSQDSSVCGTYSSTVGARCLGGPGSYCSTDIERYINVCDPAQSDLFCSTDSNQCESTCPSTDLGNVVDPYAGYYAPSGSSQQSGSCGGSSSAEAVFTWTAPSSASFTFSTEQNSYDTVLYIRDSSCTGSELGCNDNVSASVLSSTLTLYLYQDDIVTIFVDGKTASGPGSGYLSITQN
ncbi:MAG: vWA domain-containing protein [Pseudomonadota bacterium]